MDVFLSNGDPAVLPSSTIRLPDPYHYAPLTRGDSRALRNLKRLTKEKRPTDTNIWDPQEND